MPKPPSASSIPIAIQVRDLRAATIAKPVPATATNAAVQTTLSIAAIVIPRRPDIQDAERPVTPGDHRLAAAAKLAIERGVGSIYDPRRGRAPVPRAHAGSS